MGGHSTPPMFVKSNEWNKGRTNLSPSNEHVEAIVGGAAFCWDYRWNGPDVSVTMLGLILVEVLFHTLKGSDPWLK